MLAADEVRSARRNPLTSLHLPSPSPPFTSTSLHLHPTHQVRTSLLEEQEKLEREQEQGKTVTERLAEVYEELQAIGADQAEPKARRLLAGLGFSRGMQVGGLVGNLKKEIKKEKKKNYK